MFSVTLEPDWAADTAHYVIKLDGEPVACARSAYDASMTAMDIEFCHAAKLDAAIAKLEESR